MTELLPCPFCGGSASVILEDDAGDFVGVCDRCFARSEATQWDYGWATREVAYQAAVALWNTRVKVDNANTA